MFIKEVNPESNVYKDNPGLSFISFFKEFKDNHGEDKASKLISAAYYLLDRRSELLRSGMSPEEIAADLKDNLLEGDDILDYQELIDEYNERCKTKSQRLLEHWETELTARDVLLKGWRWTKEDAAEKDKLLKTSASLWQQYLKVKSEVEEEEKEGAVYGDKEMSLFEQIGNERK